MFPEFSMMGAGEVTGRSETPVFVHNEGPKFSIYASSADRTEVPAFFLLFHCHSQGSEKSLSIGAGMPRFALLNLALLCWGYQAAQFSDY
jgi:hypothetical protein